jgi:outer membrane lipoprotein LolB
VSWPNAAAGLLAALLAVALAACSSLPRGSAGQALTAAQLESFQLSGRVNLRVEKEAFPGRVRWSHAPSRDELWFYSPVGSAVAHLVQDEQGALLVDSKGKEYRAEDARGLAADVLGWDLPLAGLPYWVRGLPWPAAEAAKEQRDAQGRLSQLEQAGWTVSYLAWAGNGAQSLPAKLDLQGERMRLRLLIERWDRGNAP